MTNFEKIKDMPVEEMAKFLNTLTCRIISQKMCSVKGCQECRKLWLESEVTQ